MATTFDQMHDNRTRRGPAAVSGASLALGAMGLGLVAAAAAGLLAPTPAGIALGGLAALLTAIVLVFAQRHLRADPRRAAHARLAAALACATLLVGLADNVLLLAAGWIAAGRLMTGLVRHAGDWSEARAAAARARAAFLVGDLALVAALATLALGARSTALDAVLRAVPTLPPAFVATAAVLLVVAAAARCATPPFASWLLSSIAAPTPVSALMHAGFVNAGGFLVIRFAPVLEAVPAARAALLVLGVAGALYGSALMLVRADVKGALAASTVAQMGFMLLTCALGGYAAALWHMVAHGAFKAWLFLGASGSIVRAGERADKALPAPLAGLIALAALGAAALAMNNPLAQTTLLPLGLAATALFVAMALAARDLRIETARLTLLALPALLVAVNAAALALVEAVQPNAAAALLAPWAQLGLLALFLAAWLIQQDLAAGRRRLPPALHARLLHAGALPAAPRSTSTRKD
ncbi:proton-conducting transporter transmembrane domain-containing protein [Novosphingobium huizhouense]|uniref:proton-conducting transporter transmembrane domain-containing protein n=1 Tax=Novosphingobium huizhouense TaxID=2866625 RepID=UPI001CD821D2|nr:proton-conducting transporter membrane subunit [Novosphingobium huizhouense]